jgi:hypothetical protein
MLVGGKGPLLKQRPSRVLQARVVLLALALSACCHVGAAERAFTSDEYEAARRRVAERVSAEFTVAVVPPFVLVGDGPPENVRRDAADVVAWATAKLRADFFAKDPDVIIDIWLFASEESYVRNSSAYCGTVPETPYGFFAPCSHAIVMNASLGYGTLVHEMVHVFMAASFPDRPVWIDEGLASLFEQPVEVDGHFRGALNRRLGTVQNAIKLRRVIPLRAVLEASRAAFYGEREDVYYAEARYLLYWLQELGLLVTYFRDFAAQVEEDRYGVATLDRVLGVRDLEEAQPDWEGFVAGLEYP